MWSPRMITSLPDSNLVAHGVGARNLAFYKFNYYQLEYLSI